VSLLPVPSPAPPKLGLPLTDPHRSSKSYLAARSRISSLSGLRESFPKKVAVSAFGRSEPRRDCRTTAARYQPLVRALCRRYVVYMMRDEERYWLKVSLTIGFVVLVLLLLLISGMIGNMKHIVITILEAVQ